MTRKCRVTLKREGAHADDHAIQGQGGANRHWSMYYTINDNRARFVVAGQAPLQTNDVSIYITTQGQDKELDFNNPTTGRPDATFDGHEVSFSEGDEYTWTGDHYRLKVRRAGDSDDFKEFEATILPL